MNYKKKNGFTLIEIAVVLVILGILAVMVFPGIFAQIERQRGQEAMHTLNLIKSAVESCGLQYNYDFSNCSTWNQIGMDNPSTGANFTYANDGDANLIRIDAVAFGAGVYSIQARRNPPSTDTISLTRAATGIVTCVGTGVAYTGFC